MSLFLGVIRISRPDFDCCALSLLVEAREKAGLTQEALAAWFGQSEAFVSSYEEGARLLDLSEYIALARAIGVDPYELLKQAEAASL